MAGMARRGFCRRALCGESVLPVIVYWRSAFAELLAGALLPLLLLWILRLEERRWRAVIPLGLVVAAAWLTNAPSAVMVNYSLGLLVVVLAVDRNQHGLFIWRCRCFDWNCAGCVLCFAGRLRRKVGEYFSGALAGSSACGQFSFYHAQ